MPIPEASRIAQERGIDMHAISEAFLQTRKYLRGIGCETVSEGSPELFEAITIAILTYRKEQKHEGKLN